MTNFIRMLMRNVFVNVFKSDAVIWWAAIFRRSSTTHKGVGERSIAKKEEDGIHMTKYRKQVEQKGSFRRPGWRTSLCLVSLAGASPYCMVLLPFFSVVGHIKSGSGRGSTNPRSGKQGSTYTRRRRTENAPPQNKEGEKVPSFGWGCRFRTDLVVT